MNKKTCIAFILTPLILLSSLYVWQATQRARQPQQRLQPKPQQRVHLEEGSFQTLPGWGHGDLHPSLQTLLASCRVFLHQTPNRKVGSSAISVKAQDWYPACRAALTLKNPTTVQVRSFFEKWFKPFEFYHRKPVKGLFTGYYSPAFAGSLSKTPYYSVPIYGLPKNLVTAHLERFHAATRRHRTIIGRVDAHELHPYFTHAQIDQGALKGIAPVLAWVHSPMDRLILSIEGSGLIKTTQGTTLSLAYAGENGAPYTAIARVLIDRGIMTKDNASMQRITAYFNQHPEKMNEVLYKNQSFVFFRVLKQPASLGAQGIGLTTGYSLAVDRRWVPLGTPIWLNTTRPAASGEKQVSMQRLMIAQDTGGAIRGPVRGDVYWGEGSRADAIAGRMKNFGRYWLLLPKTIQWA